MHKGHAIDLTVTFTPTSRLGSWSSEWLSGFTEQTVTLTTSAWDFYWSLQWWGGTENSGGERALKSSSGAWSSHFRISEIVTIVVSIKKFHSSFQAISMQIWVREKAKPRYYLCGIFINTEFQKTADSESKGLCLLRHKTSSWKYVFCYWSAFPGLQLSIHQRLGRVPIAWEWSIWGMHLCFSTCSCLNILKRKSFWGWRESITDSTAVIVSSHHLVNTSNTFHSYSSYMKIWNL